MLYTETPQCCACCQSSEHATLPAKPKRALTAYNLFFRNEREQILRKSLTKRVGFAPLARNVAAKWKQIDPLQRAYFQDIASGEKERYQREMQEWKQNYRKFENCHAGICRGREDDDKVGDLHVECNISSPLPTLSLPPHKIVDNSGYGRLTDNNARGIIIPSFQPSGDYNPTTESTRRIEKHPNLSLLFSQLDEECLDILSNFV